MILSVSGKYYRFEFQQRKLQYTCTKFTTGILTEFSRIFGKIHYMQGLQLLQNLGSLRNKRFLTWQDKTSMKETPAIDN